MSELERYLSRATRGLWGRRRRAARDELASHIFERGRQHMAGGMDEAEAQRSTLRELGAPDLVSRELARVHTLPLAAPALALALLASGAGLLATRAAAQVRVPVLDKSNSWNPEAVYVATNSLKLAFLAAGVKMTGPDEAPVLSARGLPTVTLKLGRTGETSYDVRASGDLWEPLASSTSRTIQYVNLASLVRLAAEQNWPVKVAGWEKPVLSIGPAALQLDGAQNAAHLYTYMAGGLLFKEAFAVQQAAQGTSMPQVSITTTALSGIEHFVRHHVRARALPGRVYVLAVPYDAPPALEGPLDTYMIAVAQAARDGSLTFSLPFTVNHLRYVSALTDTTADFKRFKNGQHTYGNPQVRGTALVYELDGQLKGLGDVGRPNILKLSGTSDGR